MKEEEARGKKKPQDEVGDPTKMQTRNLPNTSQRHYTKLHVTLKVSRSSAATAVTTDYKPF